MDRRIAGCESLNELYEKSSCSLYLDNISIPLVFINAQDDPIIPEPLLDIAKGYAGTLHFPFCFGFYNGFAHHSLMRFIFYLTRAESRDKSAFVLSSHGGHLGFYEGGLVKPNCVTWWVSTTSPLCLKLLKRSWKPSFWPGLKFFQVLNFAAIPQKSYGSYLIIPGWIGLLWALQMPSFVIRTPSRFKVEANKKKISSIWLLLLLVFTTAASNWMENINKRDTINFEHSKEMCSAKVNPCYFFTQSSHVFFVCLFAF